MAATSPPRPRAVDAEALRLDDYFQIITKPMDLGTVTTKLNDGKYESEEDFCEEVLLTFNNAIKYNPQDSEIHLIAVQLKKKFRDLWNKARPESGVNNLLDSRELNGRFWADDKDKENVNPGSPQSVVTAIVTPKKRKANVCGRPYKRFAGGNLAQTSMRP